MLHHSSLAIGGVLLLTGLVSACGSDNNSPTTSTPDPTTGVIALCEQSSAEPKQISDAGVQFTLQHQYIVGQTSSIIATLVDDNLLGYHVNWRQTSGEPVDFTTNSPVLAFTPQDTTDYAFEVTIDNPSDSFTAAISITAEQTSNNVLSVNLDQQVVAGGNVSLRAARLSDAPYSSIDWCLTSSSFTRSLKADLSNEERPLFVAPSTSEDSLITLQANTTVDGESYQDSVNILVTQTAPIRSPYFDWPLAKTYAYQRNSPYADVLAQCVYSNQLTDSCPSNTQLPLIGQVNTNPTVADIMDRVVVSHDWMGANFEQFLLTQDPHGDFKRLLQSVTAVVISYDIRPSFYWVVTGAIYLDPDNLWISQFERDSINEAPDYRSDFGDELNFLMPWRYVKNNQYAYFSYPDAERINRSMDDLTPKLASLLYHELAHANDFFPRSTHASLQGPTLLDDYYARQRAKELVSAQLTQRYPLQSDAMFSLAQVSFHGQSATESQKNLLPSDISALFAADTAIDFYAYSTEREDAAMMFEAAMMANRYKIERDVAVTDNPEDVSANSIIVDWGQRNRIAEPSLKDRASYVVEQMMPEIDTQQLFSNLPAPIQMTAGQSWAQNLTISPITSGVNRVQAVAGLSESSTQHTIQLSGDGHRHMPMPKQN